MLMSVIDASESVEHGTMQPAGTWPLCGIKPTEIGWMCSIAPATADKRCWRAYSDNHRESPRPVPTAHRPRCPLPLLQAVPVPAAPRLAGGVRRATDRLVARLRSRLDSTFYLHVRLSSLDSLHPESGDRGERELQVCSQQPHHLVHSSSVIYHHATQRDTAREQTAHITPDYLVYHKQTQRQALGMQLRNEGMRDTGTA